MLTVILIVRGGTWERLLGLSSLNVKTAVLIAVLAYSLGKGYFMDVSTLYLMAGGAGTILVAIFLLGRDVG